MNIDTYFSTDSASFVIYDPQALIHRLQEGGDWYQFDDNLVLEMNRGNLFYAGLGYDGMYDLHLIQAEYQDTSDCVEALIRCVCGKLFLGPGEQMIGEESLPDTSGGGLMLDLPIGTYRVLVSRPDDFALEVSLTRVIEEAKNAFKEWPELE